MRFTAFSLQGQFAHRSESANRTLANSLPGPFAPWSFRSLALFFHGTIAPVAKKPALLSPEKKVLANIRSLEFFLELWFKELSLR